MPVEGLYLDRERAFRASATRAERRSIALSRARLAVFVAGVVALATGLAADGAMRWPLLVAAALAALTFGVLVVIHNRVDDRLRRLRVLAALNRQQGARVRRDWNAVPDVDAPGAAETHPFAQDLDVFGHASLIKLCGAAATPAGALALRGWLLAPADEAEIARRQEAVAELAPLLDFRQEVLAFATLAGLGRAATHRQELARFLDWAEGPVWLISRPWLVWLARVLGAVTTGLVLAHATGLAQQPYWLLPVMVNVVLWFALARRIEHTFNRAFARNSAPGQEARMFEVVCGHQFGSAMTRSLGDRMKGADRAMRRLQRLMELADIRLTTLVHFPLNAVTLWDFHVLDAVERWQTREGSQVRDWFDAFGQVEALAAFAGLRHDNPDWVLPRFGDDPVLEARGLGHPLIARGVRVPNDVRVGPPGTFLFVTGSNMSGKSTLLRAIGVNAVLAQAGAPVCATSMRLPRVAVYTSMRVQDSLEEGVSYFMAALKRLKALLDEARQSGASGGVLLYLLDEILQGTNTAERQIAVRTILAQLLESHAIGAVTSHDLNLVDEEPLQSAAVAVHFEEHLERDTMLFDYRLRPGVATSRNALKLMKLIGLTALDRSAAQ
ncbi:MAG TPA: MutS family DNA mismatch repair protein [Vicinamibacterales bacterium]|nr:MutS family DNA mismatch repair protein [Vicinamibacterales bacterium]